MKTKRGMDEGSARAQGGKDTAATEKLGSFRAEGECRADGRRRTSPGTTIGQKARSFFTAETDDAELIRRGYALLRFLISF
jgi:hypothetical protein